MSFAHHFWERKTFLEPMCVYLSKRVSLRSVRTLICLITLEDCVRAAAKKTLASCSNCSLERRVWRVATERSRCPSTGRVGNSKTCLHYRESRLGRGARPGISRTPLRSCSCGPGRPPREVQVTASCCRLDHGSTCGRVDQGRDARAIACAAYRGRDARVLLVGLLG